MRARISRVRWPCEFRGRDAHSMGFSVPEFGILQNVAAQILILDDVGELLVHVGGVDLDVLLLQVGRFEGKFIENFFQNGVQAARADVFGLLVDAGGESRDGRDGVVGEDRA